MRWPVILGIVALLLFTWGKTESAEGVPPSEIKPRGGLAVWDTARPAAEPLTGRPPLGAGGRPSSPSVRGYRARRAAQEAEALARGRLRAVAVDGKTSRGARRAETVH